MENYTEYDGYLCYANSSLKVQERAMTIDEWADAMRITITREGGVSNLYYALTLQYLKTPATNTWEYFQIGATCRRSSQGGIFSTVGSISRLYAFKFTNDTWLNPRQRRQSLYTPGEWAVLIGPYNKVTVRIYEGYTAEESNEAWEWVTESDSLPLPETVDIVERYAYAAYPPIPGIYTYPCEVFANVETPQRWSWPYRAENDDPTYTRVIDPSEISKEHTITTLGELGTFTNNLITEVDVDRNKVFLTVSQYTGTWRYYVMVARDAYKVFEEAGSRPLDEDRVITDSSPSELSATLVYAYRSQLYEGFRFKLRSKAIEYWELLFPVDGPDGILGISGYQEHLSGAERVFYRNPDDKKLYMQVNTRSGGAPVDTIIDERDSELPCALQYADGFQELYYGLTPAGSLAQKDNILVRRTNDNWISNTLTVLVYPDDLPGEYLKPIRALSADTLGMPNGNRPVYRLCSDGLDLWASSSEQGWEKNYTPIDGVTPGSGMHLADITRTPAGILRIFYTRENTIRSYVPIGSYARYVTAESAAEELAAIRYCPRDMQGTTMAGVQIVDTGEDPIAPDAANEDNIVLTIEGADTLVSSVVYDPMSNKYYIVAHIASAKKLVLCAAHWLSSHYWEHSWDVSGPYDVADCIISGDEMAAEIDSQKTALFFTRAGELRLYWWDAGLKNATLELI